MFLGQLDDKVPEIEDIARQKLEQKIKKHYSDIGKTPGVLIEENKRRKILKELGVEVKPEAPKAEEEKKHEAIEEEIKEQVPTSNVLEEIKQEKDNVLNMIPDKYKTKLDT